MRRDAWLLVILLSAGCVAAPQVAHPGAADAATRASAIGEPIEQLHDHTDASLHTNASGLVFVNWSALIPQELGTEGFAALRFAGDDAFLATDGAHAGFLVVNVTDPAKPRLVSQYSTPGGASQEAVPTPDGNWVFLNLQRQPSGQDMATGPQAGDGLGIQIIDTHDRAHPKLAGFVPVEVQGTHVMFYKVWKGIGYLIYNGQPAPARLPTGSVLTEPAGNVVHIARFEVNAGVPNLVPVGVVAYPDAFTAQTRSGCFPHDQYAEEHPTTHQLLLYIAWWDCGAVIADISDPSQPKILHVDNVLAPSTRDSIHFFRPDPLARGGKIVAWSGPEIDLSPGEPGYLRAYDITKPDAFAQIGSWRLPGLVENDKPFLFSPHNFDFQGDLMAVAHYHAGVWVLNVSDPTHAFPIAYYLPHGDDAHPFQGTVWKKSPNFPVAYFPNVYDAKWREGPGGQWYILVSERGSGLYVLKLEQDLEPGLRTSEAAQATRT